MNKLPGPRCLAYEAISSGEAPRRFKEVNRKIQGLSVEFYNLNLAVWSILLSVLVFARNRLGDPRLISLFYAHIGRNLLAFNRQQYTRKVEAPFLRRLIKWIDLLLLRRGRMRLQVSRVYYFSLVNMSS